MKLQAWSFQPNPIPRASRNASPISSCLAAASLSVLANGHRCDFLDRDAGYFHSGPVISSISQWACIEGSGPTYPRQGASSRATEELLGYPARNRTAREEERGMASSATAVHLVTPLRSASGAQQRRRRAAAVSVRCGLADLIGGDLILPDLGRWLEDVEKHKALAIYPPHEGGYEGRYLTRLRYQGYRFLDLTARGLGDLESTLTKIHPVCPPHLGKQPIARWHFPPEVDYRLSLMPPDAKGLVLWIIEAKVLSKAELQFLALLPTLRPKVKVIAECGNWRKFVWKPLREIAGLPAAEGPSSSLQPEK